MNLPSLSSISLLSHNIHKKPPTSFLISHYLRGFDIVFFQELQSAPSPPPPFHLSMITANIPATIGRGVSICIHPRLAPYASPLNIPENPGMVVAATLTFPGFSPILLCSMYVPYSPSDRGIVSSILSPLFSQFPLHVLGGDFNTCLCPLDSMGVHNSHPWPWLQDLVFQASPSLLDSYRLHSPNAQGFTRPPKT